ncbi:MAG: hypothetical protein JNL22_02650 [Bacteroidales bacterium]|nr:hypothetical protein [Bacteroidales bacterium]
MKNSFRSSKLITCLFLLMVGPLYSQDKGETVNVYIVTDVGFTSSVNDNRKQSSPGVGSIGLKFEQGKIFGEVSFTVYSQNEEVLTSDPFEYKLFGTNLLLPENNSGNISNFSFLFGTESFFSSEEWSDKHPFLNSITKKFGVYGYFSVNNTTWEKDSLVTPITINSFGLNLTYTILDIELANEGAERIKLMVFGGLTARRMGGDYALDSNVLIRKHFIGTEKIGFNGTLLGCRLEIGKFYGEMGLPWFSRKDNIAGFSGNQPVISLGLKADLNIAAKK